MAIKRIEALADAFAKLNGALNPMFPAYHLRNPGMLRAFNPKHPRDEHGNRIFKTYVAGYENLTLDLSIKCSGQSRAKLGPESPLVDLLTTYGHHVCNLRALVNFIRHALNDDMIPRDVQLGWFLLEGETNEQPTDRTAAA